MNEYDVFGQVVVTEIAMMRDILGATEYNGNWNKNDKKWNNDSKNYTPFGLDLRETAE